MEWKYILKVSPTDNMMRRQGLWMGELLRRGYSFDRMEITNQFPLGRPSNKNTGHYRIFSRADEENHEEFPFTHENPFYAPKHATNPWVDFYISNGNEWSLDYDKGDKNLFKQILELWEGTVNG